MNPVSEFLIQLADIAANLNDILYALIVAVQQAVAQVLAALGV